MFEKFALTSVAKVGYLGSVSSQFYCVCEGNHIFTYRSCNVRMCSVHCTAYSVQIVYNVHCKIRRNNNFAGKKIENTVSNMFQRYENAKV